VQPYGPAFDHFHHDATFDRPSRSLRLREQDRIEPVARHGKPWARQGGFDHMIAGNQPDPSHPRRA